MRPEIAAQFRLARKVGAQLVRVVPLHRICVWLSRFRITSKSVRARFLVQIIERRGQPAVARPLEIGGKTKPLQVGFAPQVEPACALFGGRADEVEAAAKRAEHDQYDDDYKNAAHRHAAPGAASLMDVE